MIPQFIKSCDIVRDFFYLHWASPLLIQPGTYYLVELIINIEKIWYF